MAAAPVRPNQREHILDVALALWSAHGSAKTSMRELARQCGLNVAAIYHYFESKDALLAAVIDERRYEARLADEIPELPLDLPAGERLARIYGTVWTGAMAEEEVWRLLLVEGLAGTSAAVPVGRQLLEVFGPGLTAWLQASVPEVDEPEAVVDLMVGQLFLGFITHIFRPEVPTDELERRGAATLRAAIFGDVPSP
ncbi:MAG: TetR/AcrR family transcriptional regulator [Acidimicrobiales bacterium]|nr:TetR/AcrR family transcriptional regulator [Acidimicrobiales bacterium]